MKASRRRGKNDLPEKVCPVCGRPFLWRKKWERDWESVVYCSDRCRRQAKTRRRGFAGTHRATPPPPPGAQP